MKILSRHRWSVVLCLLLSGATLFAGDKNWPQFLGPNGNLKLNGVLEPGAQIGLKSAWKKTNGSGYSQVTAKGDLVFNLYTDGDVDVLTAQRLSNGETVWRYVIGPAYFGHEGSEDGPMGTPVIHGDTIIAVGPWGDLFALNIKDGRELWKKALTKTHQAVKPHYGFSTSPIVYGDTVIVPVGGPDKNGVVAFALDSGKDVWSIPSEKVGHQSPALITLNNRPNLVVISNTHLRGLDPSNGNVYWEYAYSTREDGDSAIHPIAIGPNRFVVNLWNNLVCLEITSENGADAVREVWKSNQIRGSYSIPIYHEGYIYGHAGVFFACIDAEKGERVWKSRPPGNGAVMFVDGYIAAWNIVGELIMFEASPEGYKEAARLKVMDAGGITNPAFSNGKFLVRSHSELAAVDLSGKAGQAVAKRPAGGTPMEDISGTGFAAFLDKVAKADDKQAVVAAFMKEQKQFPILEKDNRLAIFVFQGDAADVGIHMGSISRRASDLMKQVPGTDLWYRSYKVDPDARYEYILQVNYDKYILDPLNPTKAPARQEISELIMPEYREPGFLADPASPLDITEETFTFKSEILGNEREVMVFLPPGHADGSRTYPLLVVPGGGDAREFGMLKNVLNNLMGKRVEEMVVAMFDFTPQQWWGETGGPNKHLFARAMAEELLPTLMERYRIDKQPSRHVMMGSSLPGYISMYTALKYPDAFGKVAGHSTYVHNKPMTKSLQDLADAIPADKVKVYMNWSKVDYWDPGEDSDFRRDNTALAAHLKKRGFDVTAKELNSSRGWGSWRAELGPVLEMMLPINRN